MWKFVSRRFRESIERSANFFDKRSTSGLTNVPNNTVDNNKKSTPCKWYQGRCCSNSYNEENNTNNKRWNFDHLNCSWLGAITWSSALVLGWYASQLIHLKSKYCNYGPRKTCEAGQIFKSLSPFVINVNKYPSFLDSFRQVYSSGGNILPSVHLISNDHIRDGKQRNPSSSSGSGTSDNSDSDLGDVLNSIENKLGLAAIENGHHQEGLNLLKSAATRNHAPALFNLGLCYETGLGVTADEKMAMEMYRAAAALEHPQAMYNLGIYYGQGRGGLARDPDTATRLLRLAAVKGQEDAVTALRLLEKDVKMDAVGSFNYAYAPFVQTEKDMMPMQSNLFVQNVNCEATVY